MHPLRLDVDIGFEEKDANIFIMDVDVPPKDDDDEGMVSASPWVASGVRLVRSDGEADLMVRGDLFFAATAMIYKKKKEKEAHVAFQ